MKSWRASCTGMLKKYWGSSEKRTAHFAEIRDFFPERILRNVKTDGQTRQAQELRGTAVDQLFGQTDFIGDKDAAAANTGCQDTAGLYLCGTRTTHDSFPGGTNTAAYHVRVQSGCNNPTSRQDPHR